MKRLNLKKSEDQYIYEGDEGKVEIPIDKSGDTTVFLYSGDTCRKITIKNVDNVAEALRDSLECMQSFVNTSKDLRHLFVSYKKKLWPTLDGKVVAPTFENVDIEDMSMTARAINALEKNDIMILGEIPDTIAEIKALRGIGTTVAKEILETKEKFLKEMLGSPKKTSRRKKSVPQKKVNKRALIVDSNLPKNLQKILMSHNAMAFVDEIPKDIKELLKLNKLGPSKARQILNLLEK